MFKIGEIFGFPREHSVDTHISAQEEGTLAVKYDSAKIEPGVSPIHAYFLY
jgi:hypothetical protein